VDAIKDWESSRQSARSCIVFFGFLLVSGGGSSVVIHGKHREKKKRRTKSVFLKDKKTSHKIRFSERQKNVAESLFFSGLLVIESTGKSVTGGVPRRKWWGGGREGGGGTGEGAYWK
jgi:hypothetical protein